MFNSLSLSSTAQYPPEQGRFLSFSLFLGVSMSVTAFPVLARILADFKINRSPMGRMALACAAVDDASAWCLLALVIGLHRAEGASGLVTFAATAVYVSWMLVVCTASIDSVHLAARAATRRLACERDDVDHDLDRVAGIGHGHGVDRNSCFVWELSFGADSSAWF